MAAAAEASTVSPSPASTRSRSPAATGPACQCASAYDGLPGPANTQSAALIPAAWRASSSSSGGISGGAIAGSAFGLVPAATRTCRPTLSAK